MVTGVNNKKRQLALDNFWGQQLPTTANNSDVYFQVKNEQKLYNTTYYI